MGLSDGRKSFPIGLAVLIQYRSVTDTQPPSHVAVAITLHAQASSLKTMKLKHQLLEKGHGTPNHPNGKRMSGKPGVPVVMNM